MAGIATVASEFTEAPNPDGRISIHPRRIYLVLATIVSSVPDGIAFRLGDDCRVSGPNPDLRWIELQSSALSFAKQVNFLLKEPAALTSPEHTRIV